MKLLLTSGGVTNTSIKNALVDLLGKPIADSSALCIPTAMYGHPDVGPGEGVWRFISGESGNPMCELGWRSVGVLELTALPSIDEARWVPLVRDTDVLLVSGGDALYLCHWLRESGLVDLLPSLSETVWVGLSAGSAARTSPGLRATGPRGRPSRPSSALPGPRRRPRDCAGSGRAPARGARPHGLPRS